MEMLTILFGNSKMKMNKIRILFILVVSLSLLFTSCGRSAPGTSPQNEQPSAKESNLPQYLNGISSILEKDGISISSNPIDVKPDPAPSKPYPKDKMTIPDSWVKGELQWYTGITNQSHYLGDTVLSVKGDFLLESTMDKSHTKTIYKVYRKKQNIPLQGKVTNACFKLIKVLDKAKHSEKFSDNQLAILSGRFVVWTSSSNQFTTDWTIWGYDIDNNKIFQIYSYKNLEGEFDRMDIPLYNIVSDKDILIIDITARAKNGQMKNKLVFYDLRNRHIAKVIESSVYKIQFFRKWWDAPIYSIDNWIYGEKFNINHDKNISGPYILSDIIKLNLNTWEEKTVIPKTPFRILASSPQGTLCLLPYVKGYPCHDVWIWNVRENRMNFLFKVCYSKGASLDTVPSASPEVSLCSKGVMYKYYEEQNGGERCRMFYSYKEKKAYSILDSVDFIDNSGRLLMYKSPYALYNPLPPFDFPGKKEILNGYQTYLIVEPE